MDSQTVLLIILAAIIALLLVLFQYFFKSKKRGRLSIFLSILRFITWFGAFLLLINPKFSKDEYTIEKTNLLLLTDNSSSISEYRSEVEEALEGLMSSRDINQKFNLKRYGFGAELTATDTLSFSSKTTNIAKALRSLSEVYSSNTAVVLLTDGNQTLGNDYAYDSRISKTPIYPVAIGDTTQYEDIRIDRVNANKYAFLKNKYPLEVFISYAGTGVASETVTISLNGRRVHSENLRLSGSDNSKVINAIIEAGSVGVKNLAVTVSKLENERNVSNNGKNLTVEVIDEKTNVAIVSDILHPDIGALKKAIETNEQRSVSIIKPNDQKIEDVDLFILYQPTSSFKSIYEHIQQRKANSFSIIGPNSDLAFINRIQNEFRIEDSYPLQEVLPVKNEGFSTFDISENSFDNYPPLDSDVGPITIENEHEPLLNMRIKGVDMGSPLLTVLPTDENKTALLMGENIWKWRTQAYRNDKSFQDFDEFIGKLMIYLSDNKARERLRLEFESVYEGSSEARISANYFDEAFRFDSNASLTLQLKNEDSDSTKEIPMLLKNGFYEADLSDQSAGSYQFTVSVKNEGISKSGSFRILDYDVEQQFVSTNDAKLLQLAQSGGGSLFYPNQLDALIEALTVDERYLPLQTSTKKVVSLIDFRVLLGLIAFSLALERFIRKYNGLI